MVNKAGKTVTASADSLTRRHERFCQRLQRQADRHHRRWPGEGSWPIAGYTYLILHTTSMTDCVKAQKLLEFLHWALTDAGAAKKASDLGYSVLPDAVRDTVLGKLGEVTCSGNIVLK